MQRLFTGLQPSGALHIGNYFGALEPFVELSRGYDTMLMIADYHALTSLRNPEELHHNILELTKDYVAAGIDPEKVIVFKQSDIAEHTELAWIFQCLVTVPFLQQAHAYKDKVAKGLEANAGLFAYPMLMAADILLYDTAVVPVGMDQTQHIEYAREAAAKFNNAFGQTFIEPKTHTMKLVPNLPGTDGQKMSKSYKNTIPLFGNTDEIKKAVMSIVTDSKFDKPINVYLIHRAVAEVIDTKESEFEALYSNNRTNYKKLKETLIEDLERMIAPMREKRDSISEIDVRHILTVGAEKARVRAEAKMRDVRKKIGVAI